MKLKITKNKTGNGLVSASLSGEMNIYTVSRLKDFLLKELEASAGLMLDLASVEDADTSAFQLLLFIRKEAEGSGRKFQVTDMSGRLRSIFTLYRESI